MVEGDEPREFFVELVDNNVGVPVFRVVVNGDAATVEGLGDFEWHGTDTVTSADQLQFMVTPFSQSQFATINLTPRVNAPQNGSAFVGGTPNGDNIDLAAMQSGLADNIASQVNGQQGDDTISGRANANTSVNGAAGDDKVTTFAGADALTGGVGNDTLSAGAGGDYLSGGEGDDSLDGGDGFDRASYYSATVGVKVDLSQTGPQNTGLGTDTLVNIEHISGGELSDTLTGNAGDNWLWGSSGGNDSLNGGAGNDLLMVAAGDNTLTGGDGDDTAAFTAATGGVKVSLAVEDGESQVTGQGAMTLVGIENLSGSVHTDTLTGDAGANVLAGYSGDDRLDGGGGGDILLGDGAIDLEGNGVGPITVYPDVADVGEAGGADTLTGGAGNDTLAGGTGTDTAVFSGARSDYLVTANGDGSVTVADQRPDADGTDTLWDIEFLTFSDQTLSISAATGQPADPIFGSSGADTLNGTDDGELVSGGGGNDAIFAAGGDDSVMGGDGHDGLRGQAGNDTVQGEAGDDLVSGGDGDDILDGGAGIDRASFSPGATGGVRVDLAIQGESQNTLQGQDTLIGVEHVSGTRYSDTLSGNAGDNWVWGGSDGSGVTGNDLIDGREGNDLVQVGTGDHTVQGGSGVDTLSFEGNGTDITSAGVAVSLALQDAPQDTRQGQMVVSGFENLSGSRFADTLQGDQFANILLGHAGSDSLSGGAGNDVLRGDAVARVDTHGAGTSGPLTTALDGSGADTLDGGSGDDILAAGDGDDDMSGGSGADTLFSGTGADHIRGGAGVDRFTLAGARSDYDIQLQSDGSIHVLDLRSGSPEGADTVTDVEVFAFSGGSVVVAAADLFDVDENVVTGTSAADTLDGGSGADMLDGLQGDDRLHGLGGNDRIDGGPGKDVAAFWLPEGTPGTLRLVPAPAAMRASISSSWSTARRSARSSGSPRSTAATPSSRG
ncbi:calcium-binding protein [Phenylobacterium sp. J367]|uniref:beta strand repeat-containing protein n=1 Tax=Phenylobacterium sp. J367 TaxID=2898435 RepID=UPI0021517572|nr:calcium-binding protein [Phenylobacterium sp. J367]MCR5879485.1 hypothetical protein [Phenylobacterium sp. J367]